MEIWKLVKEFEGEIEQKNRDYGQSRATLLVNFGPDGRNTPDVVAKTDTLMQMIVKVCEFYENRIQAMMENTI